MAAAVLASAGAGPAQDTPPTSPPPTTQPDQAFEPPAEALALLKQLDDPDYARREQAELDLFSLVLSNPRLEEWMAGVAGRNPSPEVRARAGNVVAKLAEHRLLGATLVSLSVKDVHPRELLAEFSRQSGVPLQYWPEDPWEQGGASGGKVSLEIKDLPFWEAVQRASEVTGMTPVEHQTAAPGALVLSPHGESLGIAPTQHHGAFAIQLRRLYRHQTAHVELGVGPDGKIAGNTNNDSNLQMEMRLLVEPKIRLTGGVSQPILEEAVDENGKSLMLSQDPRFGGGRGWTNSSSGWSVQSSLMLDSKAAAKSRTIARLKGSIEVEIATAHDSLDVKIEDLLDIRRLREGEKRDLGKRYEIGSYKIELISVEKSADHALQFEMSIAWAQTGDDQQDGWIRAQALMNSLRLEDAAGRPWSSAGGGNGWDGTIMKGTRTFHRSGEADAGSAARLVLEVPTRVMTVTIPFEFTDIPLPQWD